MANRKITDLTALADPAVDDVLPIVDVSEGLNANKNKKITYVELFKSIDNGTVTAPAIAFNASSNTGIYRSAANELSIATNGAQAIKIEPNNKTTIYGDLVVTGSQTTISSTTIDVADKNIQLGTGNSSDSGADGGGITLKGATDKTWNWVDATDSWTGNQNVNVTTGKVYKVAGNTVLTETSLGSGVVGSSLTSVGTLGSLAVTNAITAGSLDISGGADIDGTMEADAYTVNGTALNEYIADTVGAMVSSNTETNITVTYDDSDNTLDFVIGTLNQNTTGNAATATALQNARTIGGVSFDGTANISLPGVNQTGNQNTTGSAATLTTARTIGGVSFDGSANINLPGVNAAGNQNTSGTAAGLSGTPNITVADVVAASLDISGDADIDGTLEADAYTVAGTALNEYIADTVGAMVSSNTETNITVTYDDADNTLDFVIGTLNQNTTGNAATATALQTARTIGGVSFDGTGNITLPGVNATGNQNTTGSAATLTTARTIGGVSFNGSANIDLPGVNTAGNQNTTGSAAKLTTARTIGGVSFDGSGNISLPGVNQTGNQNTTGSAATLTTARTIGGVSFNGSANIDLPGVNAAGNQNTSGTSAGLTGTPNITVGDVVAASLDISGNVDIDGTLEADALTIDGTSLSETIADTVGAMVSSNTETGITVTYDDADNTLDFVVGTLNQNTTGNAATATALQNARTINGVSFDGTGNITVTAAAGTLTGSTLASGVTASSLTSVGTLAGLTTSSDVVIQNQKDIRFSEASGNGTNYVALQAPAAISSNYTLTLPSADGSSGQHLKTDGSGNLSWETPVSAASDLTGSTLASGVTASSLTSVGTLTGLTTSGNILMTGTGCIDVAAGTTAQRPGSPNAGMFRYNTTLSKFEGHDGSAWGEIGGGGGGASFYINTLSSSSGTGGGSATFNGTAYRFQISNAPATGNAAQMLVSVGGVIQKANTGTSQPSEGYAIDGNDIIFGAAPASAASWFIITYGALNAGEPTDNTVNEAKLQVSNSPTNGYFLSAQSGNTGGLTWAEVDLSAATDYADNTKVRWGTGNDLEIFHQSSDESSVIKNVNDTGWLRILSGDSNSSGILLKNRDDDVTYLKAFNEGAVELYHSNNKKLETISTGVKIHGSLVPMDGNRDLGSSSLVWQDLHIGNDIHVADNGKIIFGAGDDLQLWHDGSNSYVKDNGTGELRFISNTYKFYNAAFSETLIEAFENGAVNLYYDGVKKFETISTGVKVTGNLHLNGGSSGTDSYIYTNNAAGIIYQADDNGHIFQTYASSAWNTRLTITDGGNVRVPDNGKFTAGASDDLQIYHDSANNYWNANNGHTYMLANGNNIYLRGVNNEDGVIVKSNNAVELFYDGAKKFETHPNGAFCRGHYYMLDDHKIQLGDSAELKIWHDSNTHSYITESGGGGLAIGGSMISLMNVATTEYMFKGTENGSVELFYDGTKHFETTSDGCKIPNVDCMFVGTNSSRTIYFDASINGFRWNDYATAYFGTGQDLEIKHDSANTYFTNITGELVFNCDTIRLRKEDGLEDYLKCFANAQVELYYDGTKQFETKSNGIAVAGQVDCTSGGVLVDDNYSFSAGTGGDLLMYHNGSNSYLSNSTGNLMITGNNSDKIHIRAHASKQEIICFPSAGVQLFYDDAKKFETTSAGCYVTGRFEAAGAYAYLSNDSNTHASLTLKKNHSQANPIDYLQCRDSNNSLKMKISSAGNIHFGSTGGLRSDSAIVIEDDGGNEWRAKFHDNAHVELAYDNTKRFETTSSGVQVTGNIDIDGNINGADGSKVKLGTGSDFHLFHDGTNNYLYGTTNCFTYVCTNNTARWSWSNDGHFRPEATNTYDIGSSSQRVRNVYTNDLHLSNEGSTNDVDGTWGNYTIQEGEEDLFLLNRRNGKKYKFNLTEVN